MNTWEIREGDALERLREMPDGSVDAIVTDPPYGLEFMGKDWDRLDAVSGGAGFAATGYTDGERLARPSFTGSPNPPCANCGGTLRGRDRKGFRVCRCDAPSFPNHRASQGRAMQEWHEAWAREALRVLKPGGHLLAFGGTRTYHRLACAVEDAGFEIRDSVMWLYGSGFPKSLDVSKAIDKAAGAEREVVGRRRFADGTSARATAGVSHEVFGEFAGAPTLTAPTTPEAERWDGWGTALKPAHEPIVVARKPLVGTVAANVLAFGAGGMNIDGCRIGTATDSERGEADPRGRIGEASADRRYAERGATSFTLAPGPRGGDVAGRWPTNVALDEDTARMLDEQTGALLNCGGPKVSIHSEGMFGIGQPGTVYDDVGGASRFFYCAKASSAERQAGNTHPTVKPVELMRWLVRLVTPPGGLVLDPFAGSGTTGIAAMRDGFSFVGIEREADYAAIARERIRDDQPLFNWQSEASVAQA